jgi:hypothetical protein
LVEMSLNWRIDWNRPPILAAGGLRPWPRTFSSAPKESRRGLLAVLECRHRVERQIASGADLLDGSTSLRSFGSWLSAVKKSVREDAFLGYFTDLVSGTSVEVLHRPHELFSTLLDEWMSR